MRKYRKSVWLPVALFVYATAMAVYFIPRNHESSDTEKFLVVLASYVIIFLLWLALRAQEKRREKQDKEFNDNNKPQL